MLKIKKKDITVLSYLRQNARISLTNLSRKSGIPVSTLFDKLKTATPFLKKFTVLLDFSPLGFSTKAMIALKVKKDHRNEVEEMLRNHKQVNSAYKVNNGFDYIAEVIVKDMNSLESFLDSLEEKHMIEKKQVFYMLDTIKQEEFLSNPSIAQLMFPEGTQFL